ncbi:hypothetical protein LZ023_38230 (plasmid) [Pseudomonas silvicola]|nr:hypothetical protein LZ023_38230 [Pseudomonas silvicola]
MQSNWARWVIRVIHEPHARVTPYDGRPACAGNNNCEPICPIGAMYSGDMHVDKAVALGVRCTECVAWKLEKGAGTKTSRCTIASPMAKIRLTAKTFIIAAHGLETPKLLLMNDVANSSRDQVGA